MSVSGARRRAIVLICCYAACMPKLAFNPLLARRAVSFSALPPLSLYVHIPWCVRKCPYCDFNSHELRASSASDTNTRSLSAELETQYAEALMRDLEYA